MEMKLKHTFDLKGLCSRCCLFGLTRPGLFKLAAAALKGRNSELFPSPQHFPALLTSDLREEAAGLDCSPPRMLLPPVRLQASLAACPALITEERGFTSSNPVSFRHNERSGLWEGRWSDGADLTPRARFYWYFKHLVKTQAARNRNQTLSQVRVHHACRLFLLMH